MVTAVLQTKLFIPPLRTGTIRRTRLTRRLDEGLQQGRRLSLISAPAGYGKTSLVVEWIRQAKLPVAWLSLDRGDNDPARFWVHLLSALRSIPPLQQAIAGEEALSALQSPQLPEIDSLLTGLINEIAGIPECLLLVLDDLHLITETSIQAGLLFLLEHLPTAPQVLHLVVASRSDPPWPMARLRARAELTELRAPDLRFSLEEVQEFLTRTAGLHLAAENIAALEQCTEGWIAGLQMAVLSLQRIQQVRGEEGVAGFIRSFVGSQRFVLDYLMEEVLNQQPPEVQEFLLKTSLLDRLAAPLCNQLSGRNDSQELLTRLERDNLFLIPLDDWRRWYRYHHLFSDLLQLRLEQEFKEQIPRLHQQASEWYAQAGYVADAVHHALAAGNHYRVADLVAGNALALFYSGELPTIAKWLQSVPGDVGEVHFWLRVARAWASVASEEGNLPRAVEILEENARALPEPGDLRVGIMALIDLPVHQYNAGQLRSAYATSQRLIQMIDEFASQSGERPPIAAFACCRISHILYEWNDLEGAQRYVQESLQIGNRWGQKDSQALACEVRARVFQAQGRVMEALQTIQEAKRLADQYLPLYQDTMRAREAGLYLEQGNLAAAVRWADSSNITCRDEPCFNRRFEYLTICRVWITQGRSAEAEELLERLESLFEGIGAVPLAVKTLALQAFQAQERGDREGAFHCLKRALTLAGPERYVRTFLDLGPPMMALLKVAGFRLKVDDPLQVTIRKLVEAYSSEKITVDESLPRSGAAFQPPLAGQEYPTRESSPTGERSTLQTFTLIEPLSGRELEVLRLLNSSLTSVEIAAELVLAVSTVRTHIRNIYGKLGVNRRMEAIERARELGLL